MRYVVALLVAGLVIAAVALYSWWDSDAVERSVREHLRQQQREGRLPPELQGADIEALDLRDYNVQVPESVLQRRGIARLLARTWFLWGPAIIAACLGVAALVGRLRSRA
jgi:hypothetical protein